MYYMREGGLTNKCVFDNVYHTTSQLTLDTVSLTLLPKQLDAYRYVPLKKCRKSLG